ncbi:MAG: hypothetical protein Q8P75_03600 [bacterium]|nr:hypothetical protein [bacterium]
MYDEEIIQNREFRIENQGSENSPSEVEGWKTYRNEDIGISFKYPTEFGNPAIESTSKGESGPILEGKSIQVHFPNSFYFVAATEDYQEWMGLNFTGKEPIEETCNNPLQYSDDGNVCKIEEINNNKFIIENQYYAAECSPFGLRTSASVNNLSDSVYKGLLFSIELKDISRKLNDLYSCFDDEQFKQFNATAKRESQNVINKTNLSSKDLGLLKDFYKILGSLEFAR